MGSRSGCSVFTRRLYTAPTLIYGLAPSCGAAPPPSPGVSCDGVPVGWRAPALGRGGEVRRPPSQLLRKRHPTTYLVEDPAPRSRAQVREHLRHLSAGGVDALLNGVGPGHAVQPLKERLDVRVRQLIVHEDLVQLIRQDSTQHRPVAAVQTTVVEERGEGPEYLLPQCCHALDSGRDACRMQHEPVIEAPLLVLESSSEGLHLRDEAVQRPFPLAERPPVARAQGECEDRRTRGNRFGGLPGPTIRVEEGELLRGHGAESVAPRDHLARLILEGQLGCRPEPVRADSRGPRGPCVGRRLSC